MSIIEESSPRKKSLFREYAEAIIVALILALFIRTFVIQAFKIPSGSMIPTLLIGDHILVSKFIYGIRNPLSGKVLIPVKTPSRKDIIVFKYPKNRDQDFIKRVVGISGDTIEIVDKKLFVNGSEVENDKGVYLDKKVYSGKGQPRDNFGPVTVPSEALFVMGDNRDNSHDSRFWSFVDYKDIRGKAFVMYWSWNREEFNVRWNRIGSLLH